MLLLVVSRYTAKSTNGWLKPQNKWALEKVVPALNMAMFGIYVKIPGGTLILPQKFHD